MDKLNGAAIRMRWLWYLGVLVFTALVHVSSLGIPFHFDDFHHLAENPAVMRLGNIPRFFVDPTLFSGRPTPGMYRPLLMTSHALTYAVSKNNPVGFHAVNLGLHLINTALIMSLLLYWTRRPGLSALGALFWSTAAVQQIAVGYASARSTLLAAVFILAAVRLSADYDRKPSHLAAGTGVLMILGLFAKEIAFVLPLLILVQDLTLGRGRGFSFKKRGPVYAVCLLVMGAYLVARFPLFGGVLSEPPQSRVSYLLGQAAVFFWYLGKSLFPVNLTLILNMGGQGPSTGIELILAAAIIALFILCITLIRRAPRLSFGALWALIALAPTSTLAPLNLIASLERIYLSLLGLAVVLVALGVYLIDRSRRRAGVVIAAFCLIILMNSLITVQRHRVWASEIKLWRDMVKKAPQVSSSWTWLSLMELKEENLEAAQKHVANALKRNSRDWVAFETLVRLYRLQGRNQEAKNLLGEALSVSGVNDNVRIFCHLNRSEIAIEEGDISAAEEHAGKALEINPQHYAALFLLCQTAYQRGDALDAQDLCLKSLSIYPDFAEAERFLGVMSLNENNLITARRRLERALELGYDAADIYFNLGIVAFRERKWEEAKTHFQKGLDDWPEDPWCYFGMGILNASQGQLETALIYMEQAVAKGPQIVAAREMRCKLYLDLMSKQGLTPELYAHYRDKSALEIKWLLERGAGEELRREWEQIIGEPLR